MNETARDDSVSHTRELSLVNSIQTDSGWYTTLPSHKPDVYSTFHFNVICEQLGRTFLEPRAFRDQLEEQMRTGFESNRVESLSGSGRLHLRDYYNAVGVISRNGEIIHPNRILEEVTRFKTTDGSYRRSRKRDSKTTEGGSLIATEYAVSILTTIGEDVDEDTLEWIRLQRNEVINSCNSDFLAIKCILNILGSTELEASSCSGYDAWESNIVDRINDSLTGREVIPNTVVKTLPSIIRNSNVRTEDIELITPQLISDTQYSDGGYNILDRGFSEPHGTAELVKLATEFELLDSLDLSRLNAFIDKHSLATGGFGKVFDKDEGIEPSYYSSKIKRELSNEQVATPLPPAILRKSLSSYENMEMVYKTQLVTRCSESEAEVSAVRDYLDSYFKKGEFVRQRLLYALYVSRIVSFDIDKSRLDRLFEIAREVIDLGEKTIRTAEVTEIYQKVSIWSLLGREVPNQSEIVKHLRNQRSDSGGFAVMSNEGDSYPNLFTTYQCLRTFSLLGTRIEDDDRLTEWIYAHRSPNGGFRVEKNSRDPYQRSLQATFWALASLNILNGKQIERTYQ